MAWLNEIRKILFKQQELIKGTFDQFLCGIHSAADFSHFHITNLQIH